MPELPEVETTRRGIAPHVEGHVIRDLVVRQPRLRWPVPRDLRRHLAGQRILRVSRRAKYLLLHTTAGEVILHLGMSGNLRVVPADTPHGRHDHVDIVLHNGTCLRLHDPRRFGALLWHPAGTGEHPLLRNLGPEPLSDEFHADYLYRASRGRTLAIKQFLMNSHLIAGLGNIYANEALFLSGIHPLRAAGRIAVGRYAKLAAAIKQVIRQAIAQGGTTLRDFVQTDGRPGYFRQHLNVYGRADQPCPRCGAPIRQITHGQRSTFYCPHCQR
jgi:formamidopyrimidine-DNA glycosylase